MTEAGPISLPEMDARCAQPQRQQYQGFIFGQGGYILSLSTRIAS